VRSIFTLKGQRLADAAPPTACCKLADSGVRDMFALERSSASFGPNLSQKFQAANGSLLQSMTQSFQLPAKVAAQQLAVNRINTMVQAPPANWRLHTLFAPLMSHIMFQILESSVPRQQQQSPLSSAASMRKPRPVSAPVSTTSSSSAASAFSSLRDSAVATAGPSSLTFSRHLSSSSFACSPSTAGKPAAVRPISAVASHGAAATALPLHSVSISGGHINLVASGGSKLQQQNMALSLAAAAPVRVLVRAASAPRAFAHFRPSIRTPSAPRRTRVGGFGGEEEEEEGVTIDDGDGDGGDEVLLAMGNAINSWGRDRAKGSGRLASGAAAAAVPVEGASDTLSTNEMAKMGLLPDSMLQRKPRLPHLHPADCNPFLLNRTTGSSRSHHFFRRSGEVQFFLQLCCDTRALPVPLLNAGSQLTLPLSTGTAAQWQAALGSRGAEAMTADAVILRE
jgi:hypothetical protein